MSPSPSDQPQREARPQPHGTAPGEATPSAQLIPALPRRDGSAGASASTNLNAEDSADRNVATVRLEPTCLIVVEWRQVAKSAILYIQDALDTRA